MHLAKYHGLGNDFLVALAADNDDLDPDPATAIALCDRHRGIGADGLIYGLPTDVADARMVLLNSDGSAAEISGNGVRCLAQALLRRDGRDDASVEIETPGGRRSVRTVRGDVGTEVWMQVDMGATSPGPPIPAEAVIDAKQVTTVDIGNPHLVMLIDEPGAIDLAAEGPPLERAFSGGINVHFIAVSSPDTIDLAVWERGAGITEACGSGAAAAAVAANGWGIVGRSVTVRMPGGDAVVDITDDTVLLSGPSTFVAEVITP